METHKSLTEQKESLNYTFDLLIKIVLDTIKNTEESVLEIIKLLNPLYQETLEQSQTLKSTIHSGKELLEVIDKQLDYDSQMIVTIDSIINEELEEIKNNLRRMSVLFDQANEILPILNTIKEISEQINILAINAAIESARVGKLGAGFSVIAEEIRKLALETEGLSKEIRDKVTSLNETIRKEYEYFEQKLKGTEGLKIAREAKVITEKMEKDFQNIGNVIHDLIKNVNKQNELILNIVTELLGKVQFQDVVRQKLEKVCEHMKEIFDYISALLDWVTDPSEETKPPEIKVLIDKLYKSYVMQSQREIHEEVFNKTSKGKNNGPKIELF